MSHSGFTTVHWLYIDMKQKITISTVKAAEPTGKTYAIWDTELKTFGLQVRPGGGRSYILKYLWQGRQKTLTLGSPPSMTPDEARRQAQAAIGALKRPVDAIDPAEAKLNKKAEGLTVDQLIDQYFHDWKAGRIRKKRSALSSEWSRAKVLRPLVGKSMATQVDAKALQKKLMQAGHSDSYVNRITAFLSAVFHHAIEQKLMKANPMHGLVKLKETRLEVYMPAVEMRKLGKTIAKSSRSPFALAALRFLFMTGCRKSEVLDLEWSNVDWDNGLLNLQDSKTGPKVVTLSKAAVALLKSLPRVKGNDRVFPGRRGRLGNIWFVWEKLLQDAGLPHYRLHDIRHSVASVAIQNGASLADVGGMLGHKSLRSTERYAHLGESNKRKTANLVGRKLDGII